MRLKRETEIIFVGNNVEAWSCFGYDVLRLTVEFSAKKQYLVSRSLAL